MSNKTISIGIVCYRNFEHLYDALESIFAQDYEQIELIISDDGSDVFPQALIEQYIREHKRENILSVVVNHEEKNLGTVRHLNRVIDLASGYYLMFLAADDALNGTDALSRYVRGFEEEGHEDCYIEIAQTAMYDETLTRLDNYYFAPSVRRLVDAKDYKGLRNVLLYSACLPSTSFCFKRAFFEKYGKYDESYFLVEDVPLHIKIAELEIPIFYNSFVALKHRGGGISHGAVKALSETKKKYLFDSIRLHENYKKITDPGLYHHAKIVNRFGAHYSVTTLRGSGIKLGSVPYHGIHIQEKNINRLFVTMNITQQTGVYGFVATALLFALSSGSTALLNTIGIILTPGAERVFLIILSLLQLISIPVAVVGALGYIFLKFMYRPVMARLIPEEK